MKVLVSHQVPRWRLVCPATPEEHWPDLADVKVRFRGDFAYVDGVIKDGTIIPLCRLRYGGSARVWGFAIDLVSFDGYEDSVLPSGNFVGSPEEALDGGCILYLSDAEILAHGAAWRASSGSSRESAKRASAWWAAMRAKSLLRSSLSNRQSKGMATVL